MRSHVAALLAVSILLLTQRSHAAGYDLTSLAILSTSVVKAQRVTSSAVGSSGRVTTYRVAESYWGPLHAGETITVDDGEYPLAVGSRGPAAGPLGPDVVLFLQAPAPTAAGSPVTYGLAWSGMRIVLGTTVYGYDQLDNPGPLEAVPQESDAITLSGEPSGPGPYDWTHFETLLRIAMARATMLRSALALPPGGARTTLLVSVLPNVQDRSILDVGWAWTGHGDVVLHRVVAALAASGDVDGVLEASSRARERESGLLAVLSRADLLSRAADSTRHAHQRIEAILALGDEDDWDASTVGAVVPLLRDSEAGVRAAAVHALGRVAFQMGSGSWSDPREQQQARRVAAVAVTAIQTAWRTEMSPRVQFAMMTAESLYNRIHLDRGPQRPRWVALFALNAPEITTAVASLNRGSPQARAIDARIVLPPSAPVACAVEEKSGSGASHVTVVVNRILCPSSVPAGRYQLHVDFEFEPGDGTHVSQTVSPGVIERP